MPTVQRRARGFHRCHSRSSLETQSTGSSAEALLELAKLSPILVPLFFDRKLRTEDGGVDDPLAGPVDLGREGPCTGSPVSRQ
jgi:hypothetical protein